MLPNLALPSGFRGSVGSDPLARKNAVLNRTLTTIPTPIMTTTMSTTMMTFFTSFARPFFCGSHIQRDVGPLRVVPASLLDRVCVIVILCYRIAFDVFHDPFNLSIRAVESRHESIFTLNDQRRVCTSLGHVFRSKASRNLVQTSAISSK